jgi:hypothetical protein
MTKWQEWNIFSEDEKNWSGSDERGLLKAEYLGEYRLRLWFEEELDVSIYELDFYPLLVAENPGGVFEVLKDVNRFALVDGEYSLVWLNPDTGAYDEQAIDIAPECIRFFCNRYGTMIKDGSHHHHEVEAILA